MDNMDFRLPGSVLLPGYRGYTAIGNQNYFSKRFPLTCYNYQGGEHDHCRPTATQTSPGGSED